MAIEYLKRRVLTEKLGYQNLNKYIFEVDNFLTKSQIKKSIIELFKLDPKSIISINTYRPPNKKKRRMSTVAVGTKINFKRAIITLKKGELLPFN